MEWQPIETAPKDGSIVLIYRDGYVIDQACCWYSKEFEYWTPVGGYIFMGATHWMPLPEPPK